MPKQCADWVQAQPDGRNSHRPDLAELGVETSETPAGDLLIRNSQLPHGVSPNQERGRTRATSGFASYRCRPESAIGLEVSRVGTGRIPGRRLEDAVWL